MCASRFAPLVTALAVAAFAPAQTPTIYVAKDPMVQIAVYDAPRLLAAAEGTALGRLFAEADVAAAFAIGKQGYLEPVAQWQQLVNRLRKFDPREGDVATRAELAMFEIDWRDVHTWIASSTPIWPENEAAPAELQWPTMAVSFVLVPTSSGRERLAARFEALVGDLRQDVPAGMKLAETQTAFERPALRLEIDDEAPPQHMGMVSFGPPTPWWLLGTEDFFAAGSMAPQTGGRLEARENGPPRVEMRVDIGQYLRMITVFEDDDETVSTVLEALGLDKVATLTLCWSVEDGQIREDVSVGLKAEPGGLLGALLRGMAPLPPQPLPDGALLQVRTAFDVEALTRSVDALLTVAELDTLTELELAEDIERAWTGGAALAIGCPAKGAVVPRLFASFGIVDEAALGRLLERLHQHPGLEIKERELEGAKTVQLQFEGLPQGLQPTYALVDGTIHFAESPATLRALLRAKADGAPPALDVGDARRGDGPGVPMPGFELRFDGAAIHATLHDVWMPLASPMLAISDSKPLVPLDEMPEPDVVGPHLSRGRGVLRVADDHATLVMFGALGGPDGHAIATAFGPLLSTNFQMGWQWLLEDLRNRIANHHARAVHTALTAFEKRTGKRAASLGELVGSPELPDASVLALDGDTGAEPVIVDGKEVARSSFRYYPEGLQVEADGETIKARLIAVKGTGWWRVALDAEGGVHSLWGEEPIEAIEKAAMERGKDAEPSPRRP